MPRLEFIHPLALRMQKGSYEQGALQPSPSNNVLTDIVLFPEHLMVWAQTSLFPVLTTQYKVVCKAHHSSMLLCKKILIFSVFERTMEKYLGFVLGARWEELLPWVKAACKLYELAQPSRKRAERRQEERSINTLITVPLLISIYPSSVSTFKLANENALSKWER